MLTPASSTGRIVILSERTGVHPSPRVAEIRGRNGAGSERISKRRMHNICQGKLYVTQIVPTRKNTGPFSSTRQNALQCDSATTVGGTPPVSHARHHA